MTSDRPGATSIMPSVAMNGGRPRTDDVEPVDEADQAAEQHRAEHAEPDRPAPVGQEHAGHHAAQDHAGADRQVDAAGDDDEGRAQRQDPGHRRAIRMPMRLLG